MAERPSHGVSQRTRTGLKSVVFWLAAIGLVKEAADLPHTITVALAASVITQRLRCRPRWFYSFGSVWIETSSQL